MVRAADRIPAGPWFKSGCAISLYEREILQHCCAPALLNCARTAWPRGYGDGLGIHWVLPAGVRILSLSLAPFVAITGVGAQVMLHCAVVSMLGHAQGLYSSVVERQSCKLKVLGSVPSGALASHSWICFHITNSICANVRTPGVEPGSQAWEACMIPLHYMRSCNRTAFHGQTAVARQDAT